MKGFIKTVTANLYRKPDRSSEVVAQFRLGETFTVTAEHGDWLKVKRDYDSYPGFIPVTAFGEGDWLADKPKVVAVRNMYANVYAGPKVQYELLTTLPLGSRLPLVARDEEKPEWCIVELPAEVTGGKESYIHAADLDLAGEEWTWKTVPELRRSLVRTARRFLGVPYRWGGESSFGLDCSGYVQHLYKLHGLFLPRDADQQARYRHTRAVDRQELVPGDLLFFAKYGHVGMAISHDEFIHATTHQAPVVQISKVDDPHWVKITDEIRRYKTE